jgi:hypothetical protein
MGFRAYGKKCLTTKGEFLNEFLSLQKKIEKNLRLDTLG